MNFTPLTQPQYEDARYNFLLKTEEQGTPKLRPYVDSRGFITIGVGFNLNDATVRATVLAALGIQNAGADAAYYQQLSVILAAPAYTNPASRATALARAVSRPKRNTLVNEQELRVDRRG
jgi:GH24 family phage-related lysozyme (muramidase)